MDPATESFETLAALRLLLGIWREAAYAGLIDPVQRGRVFAWEAAMPGGPL